ncbi:MAG TPA: hypothetical protein PKE62_00460 [Anaerolineales bacterium]|nr:hypothetical protein [Anaerolineales bacterium]
MGNFIEIIQLLGEQLTNIQARTPVTPQSEEFNRRGFFIFRAVFMAFVLIVASIAPVGVVLIGSKDDNFSIGYLGISIVLALSTIAASIFVFPKVLLLIRQYSVIQSVHETITVEDDIKYELGIELLLFIFTFIPVAHIIFCSLTIDRAANILEITNSSRQRIRRNSANIAGYSIMVFMINSLIVSLALLILGTTVH